MRPVAGAGLQDVARGRAGYVHSREAWAAAAGLLVATAGCEGE